MFTDPIAYHAVRQPHAVAAVVATANISYAKFNRAIDAVAAYLEDIVPVGGRVAIAVDDQYFHWLLVLALGRMRACSVTIEPARSEILLPLLRPDVLLSDRPGLVSPGIRDIRISTDLMRQVINAGPRPLKGPRPGPHDPARIVTSSGTTGIPKRVLFTHQEVVNRVKSGVFGQMMRYDPRILAMVGLDTFGGFGAPLRTWWFGGAVCLFKVTWEALVARDVRGLVLSPRQLQAILSYLPPDFTPLPNLTITVGGSALPRAVGVAARLRLSPNVMLTYGSTETTTVAICPIALKDRDPEVTGVVVPWAEMEAVGPDGRPLPPGEVGEIRIRCAEMSRGYLDDPEATARYFRDGWFYPGDIGSVSEDRILKIVGRTDDVLNFSGAKISPDVVEEALANCPGVTDQAVFALADEAGVDQPWAAIVAGPGFDAETARAKVADHMPWAKARLRFLRLDAIPRNPGGKIERYKLKELASEQSKGAKPR